MALHFIGTQNDNDGRQWRTKLRINDFQALKYWKHNKCPKVAVSRIARFGWDAHGFASLCLIFWKNQIGPENECSLLIWSCRYHLYYCSSNYRKRLGIKKCVDYLWLISIHRKKWESFIYNNKKRNRRVIHSRKYIVYEPWNFKICAIKMLLKKWP